MWNFELARKKLDEEGRTSKWLAEQIGLDIKSLGHILRGRKPSLPVLKLIALKLGVPEADLLLTDTESEP